MKGVSSPRGEIKGQALFRGEIITKMGWCHLELFFSRTTELVLTRLSTNHSRREGIKVCSNEGNCSYSRGDNSKRVIIH
jgi:hypothetical protein